MVCTRNFVAHSYKGMPRCEESGTWPHAKLNRATENITRRVWYPRQTDLSFVMSDIFFVHCNATIEYRTPEPIYRFTIPYVDGPYTLNALQQVDALSYLFKLQQPIKFVFCCWANFRRTRRQDGFDHKIIWCSQPS
jgi:hypothetical protein